MNAQEFSEKVIEVKSKEKENITLLIEKALKNHTGARGISGHYEINIPMPTKSDHSRHIKAVMTTKGFSHVKVYPYGSMGMVSGYEVRFELPSQGGE